MVSQVKKKYKFCLNQISLFRYNLHVNYAKLAPKHIIIQIDEMKILSDQNGLNLKLTNSEEKTYFANN